MVHWLNRGGVEMWVLELLRSVDRNSMVIDVCCKGAHPGEMADEARATGAAVLHCPAGALGSLSPTYRRRLARVIRQGRYDVVHSHLGDMSVPILQAALDAGVRSRIVTYHQTEHRLERLALVGRWFRAWQRRARLAVARHATGVFGCSRAVLDGAFPAPVPGPRFGVQYAPVDAERFRPDPEQRVRVGAELGLSPSTLRVVNVGNVGYAKNQAVIVETAQAARAAGLDVVFLIVGDGPLREELAARIGERGLGEQVRLLGRRGDVPRLLQGSDLAMHPSVTEGLPVSVLEYQACGLPVVTSSVPPVMEAVAPASRGFARSPHDAAGFASVIGTLAGDAELRRRIGAEGRAWVAENFGAEQHLSQLRDLYSADLAQHGPGARPAAARP